MQLSRRQAPGRQPPGCYQPEGRKILRMRNDPVPVWCVLWALLTGRRRSRNPLRAANVRGRRLPVDSTDHEPPQDGALIGRKKRL